MGATTGIAWTDCTFNPWRGCTKVSDGCKNCYAENLSKRNPGALGVWGPKGSRPIAAESYWRKPIAWNKEAETEGVRRRVFCSSLADVFEGRETMPWSAWEGVETARHRLWGLIIATPHLDWQLLTKRPQNVMAMAPERWYSQFPRNVWIGTSVENQQTADERIPHLLRIPASVRFLSCEPLLGEVTLGAVGSYRLSYSPLVEMVAPGAMVEGGYVHGEPVECPGIHWVIIGGESGSNARPFVIDWGTKIVEQCREARVPVFFKQLGDNPRDARGEPYPAKAHHGTDPAEWPAALRLQQFPEVTV